MEYSLTYCDIRRKRTNDVQIKIINSNRWLTTEPIVLRSMNTRVVTARIMEMDALDDIKNYPKGSVERAICKIILEAQSSPSASDDEILAAILAYGRLVLEKNNIGDIK